MALRRAQPQSTFHSAGLILVVFAQNIPSLFSSHSWPVKRHGEHCRDICVQSCYHKYLAYGDYSINIIYYNSHQTNILIYSSFLCQKLNFSFKNIGIHLTSNYAKYILIFLMYFRWDILENYSTSRAFFFFADQHMSIFITLLKNAYYGIIKAVRRLKFKRFILICKLLINDFMHRIC